MGLLVRLAITGLLLLLVVLVAGLVELPVGWLTTVLGSIGKLSYDE